MAASFAVPATAAGAAPDDPMFDQQWPFARESVLGRAAAWQRSTGSGAVVAVLDTGVNFSHPDLQGAFWTNLDEIPGNRVDDDRNGFVDDVHGVDIINRDGDPGDDEGHGTHVAGLIAARAGNRVGGAGLAPGAQLMVVKVLDRRRSGTAGGLAEGIRYALANGAKIINTSVNGDGQSRSLIEALRAADAAGAVVVASAGNDGRNIDVTPSYPASYANSSIIGVGATGETGAFASFSNRGVASVDIAAPGEDVLSTASDGGYELRSGTSMAAPLVSASLALMSAARPELDGTALRSALLGAARREGLLSGILGAGALDTAAAVSAVAGPLPAAPLSVRTVSARAVRGAVLTWNLSGDSSAVARVRVIVDGRTVAERTATAADTLRVRARPGLHRARFVAVDAAGTRLAEGTSTFRVRSADWRVVRKRSA